MAIPRFLYRGDKYGNKTLPEKCYCDGLFSKMIQGGNPAYISKNGLFQAISCHIAPKYQKELEFYNSTHFLSFTEDYNIALYYAAERKLHEMIEVEKYSETRYIFELDLHKCKIESLSEFIFKVSYTCNRDLIEPPSLDTLELYLLRNINCNICNDLELYHSILLIDVVSLIKKYPEYRSSREALRNAKRDKEWLVLPNDNAPGLYGLSARIPRASFWSIKSFRLLSERPRTLEESSGGIIIDEI